MKRKSIGLCAVAAVISASLYFSASSKKGPVFSGVILPDVGMSAPEVPKTDFEMNKPVVEKSSAPESDAITWNHETLAAHRARKFEPAFELISPRPILKVGDRLQLPVFPDAVLDSVISDVTSFPNGAVGMTAKLEGEFRGMLYLSNCGGELRVHADILGGNDFYIRYDPEQHAHIAIELDRENSDIHEDCATCRLEQEKQMELSLTGDEGAAEADETLLDAPVAAEGIESDAVVSDVMVVYTPAAKAAEGGLNGINNNIALAMMKGNQAHGNSDTKMTLNLVHSAETVYTESGDMGDDLRVLRYTGSTNSAMDEVHVWRDAYSADFVCLLESNPGGGGLGYVLNSALGRSDLAFNVNRVQQTDVGFTMVHELAHNMGCGHSKTQTVQSGPGGIYSFSAGWQWADAGASPRQGYCTVMTYANFNSSGPSEYTRVPHFSNPSINYTGAAVSATGNAADGDNARAIRNVRYAVSDYRIPDAPVTDFPCSNNFEKTFSPWRYYSSEIDWERLSGETGSTSTGPSSANDGNWYVYVESSGNGVGFPFKEAILGATFDFSALGAPEISFAYHMYGSSMGSLALQASTDGGANWATLWSLSGNQGDAWFTTNINLSVYVGLSDTQLRFRGVTGTNFRSDMALDSIVVSGDSFDIDGDGIPGDWETLYFGGPTNAVATGNPDGDKYTNLEEYIAGLNPTNSDGLFLTNLTAGAVNTFNWNSVSGRLYSVYWTDSLLLGFTLLQSNLTSGMYTDTLHSTESDGFYKLEVKLAP